MHERIGISLGSLLPWSAFPLWDFLARSFALPLAAAMTKEIGASFWQVLPFKGVTAAALEKTEIPVRYAELAWNGTSLWRHIRGEDGNAGMPTKWQDVLLFPKPQVSRVRTAEILRMDPWPWFVTHDIPEATESWPGLVEIHPELNIPPGNLTLIAASCLEMNRPYVLDTKHMRRRHREGKPSPLQPWELFLETLLPITQAVHIQPLNKEELIRTLAGYQTELWRMLGSLQEGFEGDLIIEIQPTLWGTAVMLRPQKLVSSLRKVRNLLEAAAL